MSSSRSLVLSWVSLFPSFLSATFAPAKTNTAASDLLKVHQSPPSPPQPPSLWLVTLQPPPPPPLQAAQKQKEGSGAGGPVGGPVAASVIGGGGGGGLLPRAVCAAAFPAFLCSWSPPRPSCSLALPIGAARFISQCGGVGGGHCVLFNVQPLVRSSRASLCQSFTLVFEDWAPPRPRRFVFPHGDF